MQQRDVDRQQVRDHLKASITAAEQVLNGLSACMELPRLLLGDQEQIRRSAMERVTLVLKRREAIDAELDGVMEGWRLSRLPRLDRDILRLAVVDLRDLEPLHPSPSTRPLNWPIATAMNRVAA